MKQTLEKILNSVKKGAKKAVAVGAAVAMLSAASVKADQNYLDIWNWSYQVNDGEHIKVKENAFNQNYPLSSVPLKIYGWGPTNGDPIPHKLGEYGIDPNKAYLLEFRFEAETSCPDGVDNVIDLNYWQGVEGTGSPLNPAKRNFFMRQHPDSPRKGTLEEDPDVYDLIDLTNYFTKNAQINLPNITSSTPRTPEIYDKWQKIISNYADIHPKITDGNLPDGKVDFKDFSVLAGNWQRIDCNSTNNWCDYADLNRDGNVNEYDLMDFGEQWLVDPNTISQLTPKVNGMDVLDGKYLEAFRQFAKSFYGKKENEVA